MKIFERRKIASDKNGEIIFRRLFHRLKVTVQGHDQSSKYIADMWADALGRLPADLPVKRVLILGLGMGNIVPILKTKFKDVLITAVEWDSEMIQLAEEQGTTNVEVLHDDAIHAVQSLPEVFDLVIIDLFKGGIPEPRLAQTETQQALKHLLRPDGRLVVNVFTTESLLALFDQTFRHEATWKWQFNTLALFRR